MRQFIGNRTEEEKLVMLFGYMLLEIFVMQTSINIEPYLGDTAGLFIYSLSGVNFHNHNMPYNYLSYDKFLAILLLLVYVFSLAGLIPFKKICTLDKLMFNICFLATPVVMLIPVLNAVAWFLLFFLVVIPAALVGMGIFIVKIAYAVIGFLSSRYDKVCGVQS